MSAWQPIETAPRDGTWFVICTAGEQDSCEAGCYDPLLSDHFVEADNGLYKKERVSLYDWTGFNNFHRATHWIPLPYVPALEALERVES
jgi:hypothetical protein